MENSKNLEAILKESEIIKQEKVNEIVTDILEVLPKVIANGQHQYIRHIFHVDFNMDIWRGVMSELETKGFKSEFKCGFFKGIRLIITW